MNKDNKNIAIVIAVMLFAVAIVKLPIQLGQGRAFLLGLFQIGVLVVFFAVLWKVNRWVALFLLLATVSRTVPTITYESQHALRCVLYGLGWYYFIYVYADKKRLTDVMCVIAFAHFMATFIQYFKIPSLFVGAVSGLTCNPNEGSALFALCFPAFLVVGHKRYLPMVIAGLLMIGSLGGFLAVSIGVVFYILLLRPRYIIKIPYLKSWKYVSYHTINLSKYWILSPILPIITCFLTFIHTPIMTDRWLVWTKSFEMYLTSWKWGCGLGHWETISRELVKNNIHLAYTESGVWTRLHNTFLNALMEMGIGFAVVYFGYLISLFRRYTKQALIPFTALIVILVCSSTNSMFRMNAVNAMLAITWLAILQQQLMECSQIERT